MNVLRPLVFFSLLGCLLIGSGCATKELWEQDAFREPSSTPNLKLGFDSDRKDVLVIYDELNDRAFDPTPRAYYLFQNVKRIEARKKPDFVSPDKAAKCSPVTIVASGPLTGTQTNLELCAIAATNSANFQLYAHGHEMGQFYLPVYKDGVWQTQKALLTPLTLGADATVVGGVLAAWWIEAGGPGVGH